MREPSRAIISNSLQVFPPFREVGRTALELVREGPGRVRFATGAHGELDPAVSTRRTPQMLARLALVVLTVAADWGPPEPKKRSVRQHDAIDPDMAKKIVEGKGCWWEGTTRPSPRADATRGRVGDDWEGMLTCACTCGSCDQRGPASRRLGRSRRVARGPRRGPRRPGGADRDPPGGAGPPSSGRRSNSPRPCARPRRPTPRADSTARDGARRSWLDRCCNWNADTLKAPLWPMRCCASRRPGTARWLSFTPRRRRSVREGVHLRLQKRQDRPGLAVAHGVRDTPGVSLVGWAKGLPNCSC